MRTAQTSFDFEMPSSAFAEPTEAPRTFKAIGDIADGLMRSLALQMSSRGKPQGVMSANDNNVDLNTPDISTNGEIQHG
jgi:hypothetical protein